jgi:hypothetical protein
MRQNGGRRPGLFDTAFLLTRYGKEFDMLAIPTFVRRAVLPLLYHVGRALGKYGKYRNAPQSPPGPVENAADAMRSTPFRTDQAGSCLFTTQNSFSNELLREHLQTASASELLHS